MEELDKMVRVRKKLMEIDTLLYEVARDYRVSGHPVDNQLMRGAVDAILHNLEYIWSRCRTIMRDAKKSHVTGE